MYPQWERVTKGRLLGFVIGIGLFLLLVFRSEPGFVFLLDHANLLFHEAGHPIVGFASYRLEPYGGTMGQLAFPLILAAAFWRKGQTFGFAASAIWFFENFFNIARYMADARVMKLPLVGGGDHDWNTIFFRWNLLPYDTAIAAGLNIAGWIGIVAVCGWVMFRAWKDLSGQTAEATPIAMRRDPWAIK